MMETPFSRIEHISDTQAANLCPSCRQKWRDVVRWQAV